MESGSAVRRVIVSDLIIEILVGFALFAAIGKLSGHDPIRMAVLGSIYGAMSYFLLIGLCNNFGSLLFEDIEEEPERIGAVSALGAMCLPMIAVICITIILVICTAAYLASPFFLLFSRIL